MSIEKDLFHHYSLQVAVLLWWQGNCGIFLFERVHLGAHLPLHCLADCNRDLKSASAGNSCPCVGTKRPWLWAWASTAECEGTKSSQSKRRKGLQAVLLPCLCSACRAALPWTALNAGQFKRYHFDKLWSQVTDNIPAVNSLARRIFGYRKKWADETYFTF